MEHWSRFSLVSKLVFLCECTCVCVLLTSGRKVLVQQWAQVFVSFVESSTFRYSGSTYSEISPGLNQEPLLVL